jgi:hypothetical protein
VAYLREWRRRNGYGTRNPQLPGNDDARGLSPGFAGNVTQGFRAAKGPKRARIRDGIHNGRGSA